MRALVLNGDKFAVEERPMPEPDVGEVLFRTHYSGICGTDLHAPDLNFYHSRRGHRSRIRGRSRCRRPWS